MRFPYLYCSLVPTATHVHAALVEPDFAVCIADDHLSLAECPDGLIRLLTDWRNSLHAEDIVVLACTDDSWPEDVLNVLGQAGFEPEFQGSAQRVSLVQARARQTSHGQERARLLAFLAVYSDRTDDDEMARRWALRRAPTLLELEEIQLGSRPYA